MVSRTRSRWALRVAAVGVILLVLGCTADPGPNPDEAKEAVKEEILPAISSREQPVEKYHFASASDGERLVSLGSISGPVHRVAFWYSDDDGATWAAGDLSEAGQQSTPPGASVHDVLAVDPVRKLWCAFGYAEGDWFTWTSTDGRAWDQQASEGLVEGDNVTGLAATQDGFVASGYYEAVGERERPAIWRSADGVAWDRQLLAGEGWFNDVTAQGNTVMAVGVRERSRTTSTGKLATPIAQVSADRGVNWQEVSMPNPKDATGFWRGLSTVTADPKGWVASGSYFNGEYAPAVYTSQDAKRWKVDSAKSLRQGKSSEPETASRIGTTLIASVSPKTDSADPDVLLYRDGKKWKEATVPTVEAGLEVAIESLDSTSNVAVASVTVTGEGSSSTELWTTSDGEDYRRADLAPTAQPAPVLKARDLARLPEGVVIVGSSQGLQTTWTQGDNARFRPPSILAKDPARTATGLAVGSGEDLLIWGTETRRNTNALTWLRTEGDTTSTRAGTFQKVAPYHYSQINDALWAHDRWIVVGRTSTNGGARESALVSTSADGLKWKRGTAAKTYRRGDALSDTDRLTDLAGLEATGRGMSSVADLAKGYVAVGSAHKESKAHPAYWTSDTGGETWKLGNLPDKGLSDASADSVSRLGEVILASGTARTQDKPDQAQVWVSTDNAKSWQGVSLGTPGEVSSAEVTAVGERLVVVATATSNREVWMFSTSDGRSWREEKIDLGLTDGERIDLNAWVGGATEATILARIYDNKSARHELLKVPIVP